MSSAVLRVETVPSSQQPGKARPGNAQEVAGVVPASRMPARPPLATLPTGLGPVDALTGGLPRGALTEIFGPASSGRTSLLLSALAQATARGEVCALIDASDSFDPQSAEAAGVELRKVLWVRCGRGVSSFSFLVSRKNLQECSSEKRETRNKKLTPVERALKVADFLLQAGGFGMVVVDLGEVPPTTARRVPLTSWFRFRRAVEHTATALVVLEEEAFAKSAASLVLKMQSQAGSRKSQARTVPTHARLLCGTEISVEVVRAVAEKKKSARGVSFATRAQWAV